MKRLKKIKDPEALKDELVKNLDAEAMKKQSKKTLNEFKEFISKGDVLDLAVGVIIGSAFGKIVTALVENILMPVIGVIIGGIDFTDLSIKVGDATVSYGVFIQNVIDFLIIAVCIFFFVKAIRKITGQEEEEKEEAEPEKDPQVVLLEEIRDLLKEEKTVK
jgi:large conductance mechanosensitive channel